MLRSSKPMASRSKLALTASLEKEENSAKKAAAEQTSASGEIPYYDSINSKVYKMVFAQLNVAELKIARCVCKKWHLEIFPLLEEKSCFEFLGLDNPSDLTKARLLSTFLNVVPKDSFQWKMLKALYPKPDEALPIPVMVQWSNLRIKNANYLELRQWVARIHMPNVSFLQLSNVRLNWSKYLLMFRELEGLSKIHDSSISVDGGIWEEFEKGCAFNEKLISTTAYQSQYGLHNNADLIFHSMKIKEIKIRRARLEEVILFLKLFLAMECVVLEHIEISAEDCLRGCAKTKKKNNVRLQEPKTVLFAHLGALLSRNGESLKTLKVSFRHSSIAGWFEQYTKGKYEDVDGALYKPDLRDFILFMKHHRWQEAISLNKLETLVLEFENKKIPTVEEIEYLTTFISTLNSLTTLSLSHFLLTSYNSLSMPLLLNRIEGLITRNRLDVSFGISLRNNDTEGLSQSSKDRDQLPANLELFYGNIKSLIVTCHSHAMDVRFSLFPWSRKGGSSLSTGSTKLSPTTSTFLGISTATSTTGIPSASPYSVEDLWIIDERPRVSSNNVIHEPLFHMSELVISYPNLVTLIIRDSENGLKVSGLDLVRWAILDDYGMQLMLGQLKKLKHLDVKGNLFFLTDSGVTGLSPGQCQQVGKGGQNQDCPAFTERNGEQSNAADNASMRTEVVEPIMHNTKNSVSFGSLKALEYCNLEYVGPKFTNISLLHGFNGMDTLKFIRISGLIQVDTNSIKRFKDKFSSRNCQIYLIQLKQ